MKRIYLAAVILALACLAGCSSTAPSGSVADAPAIAPTAEPVSPKPATSSQTAENEEDGNTNILIAYFSIPEEVDTTGVDAVASASIVVQDGEVLGNVQYMANIIQQTVGGDLFRIETVESYPQDHEALVDQAAEEQDMNLRPELATALDQVDSYDVVFLGYPNWWADMPQALYTFLESYDLSGKTIIPFCPHGGSGFSRTVQTIAELQPDATVSGDGLTISRNDVADSADSVAEWATGVVSHL